MTHLERTVYSLLNDDCGITTEAYFNLVGLVNESKENKSQRIQQMFGAARATDGRYYLPEDFVFDN